MLRLVAGVGCAMALIGAGPVWADSQIAYRVQLGGSNNGGTGQFTPGQEADGLQFERGTPLTWSVVVEASGVHNQPGHPSHGFQIYGAANLVFDLELHVGTAEGPLADADFYSTAQPGAAAAFARSYKIIGSNWATAVDRLGNGGPYMGGPKASEVTPPTPKGPHTFPTAEPGKLIGMGCGYKDWLRATGGLNGSPTPGVGMTTLPGGFAGLGVVPVAEGQIDTTNLPLGTYVLKVKKTGNEGAPGSAGNNVLRGDMDMRAGVDRPAFAVAANQVVGDTITFQLVNEVCTGIRGRYVFYNNSYYDGNNPAANANDDNAIDTTKQALLPTQTSSFANYTTYSRGIVGIMFDICGMPPGYVPKTQSDNQPTVDIYLTMGNDTGDPYYWPYAPDPTVSVRPGAGDCGCDRVTLIWQQGQIPDRRWLLIMLMPDDWGGGMGLTQPDYFMFGNQIGDGNGDNNTDGTDVAGAKNNPHGPGNRALVTNKWDFNKNSLVDGTDVAIAKNNGTNPGNRLKRITMPPPP